MRATPIVLLERTEIETVGDLHGELKMGASGGVEILAKKLVYAAGAWTRDAALYGFAENVPVAPRKGQMLRVRLPEGMALAEVHRNERVYVVPRTSGPQAGTALIGATVEDVGFDVSVHAEDLTRLRGMAAELVPELGSEANAPLVEAWAGLRPATPDALPLLGAGVNPNRLIASGHYRNGVLLAPATAVVIADLLTGKTPAVDLSAFSLRRFSR